MPTYVVQLGGKNVVGEPALLDLEDDDQARRFAQVCLIKAEKGQGAAGSPVYVDIGKQLERGPAFLLGRWEWGPDTGYRWRGGEHEPKDI